MNLRRSGLKSDPWPIAFSACFTAVLLWVYARPIFWFVIGCLAAGAIPAALFVLLLRALGRPASIGGPGGGPIGRLGELEWKRFQGLVGDLFRGEGYSVREAGPGADGGVDLELFRAGGGAGVGIVQVKAWKNTPVGVAQVRELFGVKTARRATRAVFVTSGYFTEDAQRFAREVDLELIDGAGFRARLNRLAPAVLAHALRQAFAGDFATPTCPSCGTKMVLRRGAGGGVSFWGCRNFPRCRGRLFFAGRVPAH